MFGFNNKTEILAFGDSNTWGRIPQGDRYNKNQRWAAVLQNELGRKYKVIENGVSGRITNIDDPEKPDLNALKDIYPLAKEYPKISTVIIMLGTAEFKTKYNRTPFQILRGIISCKEEFEKELNNPNIILVIPTKLIDSVNDPVIKENYQGTSSKFDEFIMLFKEHAKNYNVTLVDANELGSSSPIDGRHMDEQTHLSLGKKLAEIVKSEEDNTNKQ